MAGRKRVIAILCAGLLALYGCGGPSSGSGTISEEPGETNAASGLAQEGGGKADSDTQADTATEVSAEAEPIPAYARSMELQYAENFTIDYYEDGYTLLTTTMDGERFLLVPEGKEVPQALIAELENGTPESGEPQGEDPIWASQSREITVLRRPAEGIYLVASSVMDLFSALDGLDAVSFSGQKAEGWYIEAARAAMERGDILYAGKYNKPDYEMIVSGNCTLAIENTMISHSPEVVEKLEDFGIPVMIDYSSYESHPLGRVEWVRFYGALLGKEEEADRIFEEQCEILAKVSAEETTDKTVAFFFLTSNGLVQVRQSDDYVPKMIELAGGNYIFQDLGDPGTKRSTVNMQVEDFYAGAKDADFLIYNSSIDGGVPDVEALLDKCGLLADFQAVKEGNVWCTTNDLYQQSLSIGYLIEDIHGMLRGEKEGMHYLFHLE
ncbi:MAG: ABC transporter substrate-binding protein [Blautia sp.]|nr:ABC transporter substrate-binding protein [Blautia sp.]